MQRYYLRGDHAMQLIRGTGTSLVNWRKSIPDGLKLFLMAMPFVLFVLAFSYVPLFGWSYAFFDYKPGISLTQSPFTGLKVFATIFNSGDDLIRVMKNTLIMSFMGILSSPLPVVFAILLNEMRGRKFKKLVQTTTTLPNFISWIVVFSLSFAIFSSDGMYNSLLRKVGLPISDLNILGNNDYVWLFQWAIGTWKWLGWGSVIYLATISGIDSELYDAANVDGANRFQTIMNVTVPGLYSTYLVLLLLSISNMLSNGFDQYFVFFNPLVADRIEVLDYYVYKIGILTNDYPQATALGMAKTVISIAILFTTNLISKKLRGNSIF